MITSEIEENTKEITIDTIKEKRKKGEIFPLTYDVIFKSVFIRNPDILVKMLKDIFDIKEENKPITMAGFETVSPHKDGKTYRSDMLVTYSEYSHVLMEMNNQKESNVIDRNTVNLTRILSQILEKGTDDMILKDFRFRGLNFNNFENASGNAVSYNAICDTDTKEITSEIYTFCNIDIAKCSKLVYNEDVRNLSKAVRWGAILTQTEINKISNILEEDMLTMEEKERFLNTIKEINEDDKILTDWISESNAKLKFNSQMHYAKEEGIEQGIEKGIEQGIEKGKEVNKLEIIKNMLKEGVDYNFITRITGKTTKEIKQIEQGLIPNI